MFSLEKHSVPDKKLLLIPTDQIVPNPNQPRRVFDEYELNSLTESIRQNGLLQPLLVRLRKDGIYELVAGERRLRAAKRAGISSVACLVQKIDDEHSALFSVIENLQRKNLSMFEEAEGLFRLIRIFGISQFEASERLGIAQSTLANKLRLLKLDENQRRQALAARLTERHIRAVIRLDEGAKRDEALNTIIAKGLTAPEAEQMVEMIVNPIQVEEKKQKQTVIISDIRIFANSLSKMVSSMRNTGLAATTHKNETDDYIEYRVRIPKIKPSAKSKKSSKKDTGQLTLLA